MPWNIHYQSFDGEGGKISIWRFSCFVLLVIEYVRVYHHSHKIFMIHYGLLFKKDFLKYFHSYTKRHQHCKNEKYFCHKIGVICCSFDFRFRFNGCDWFQTRSLQEGESMSILKASVQLSPPFCVKKFSLLLHFFPGVNLLVLESSIFFLDLHHHLLLVACIN